MLTDSTEAIDVDLIEVEERKVLSKMLAFCCIGKVQHIY